MTLYDSPSEQVLLEAMGAKGTPNTALVGLGRCLGNVTSGLRPEGAEVGQVVTPVRWP